MGVSYNKICRRDTASTVVVNKIIIRNGSKFISKWNTSGRLRTAYGTKFDVSGRRPLYFFSTLCCYVLLTHLNINSNKYSYSYSDSEILQ